MSATKARTARSVWRYSVPEQGSLIGIPETIEEVWIQLGNQNDQSKPRLRKLAWPLRPITR
jgi:hypothetical protein